MEFFHNQDCQNAWLEKLCASLSIWKLLFGTVPCTTWPAIYIMPAVMLFHSHLYLFYVIVLVHKILTQDSAICKPEKLSSLSNQLFSWDLMSFVILVNKCLYLKDKTQLQATFNKNIPDLLSDPKPEQLIHSFTQYLKTYQT